MKRRQFVQWTAGVSTLTALGAAPTLSRAEIQDINEAINKAGRQRMLSQRMAKAWLALGQNVEVHKAARILEQSMNLFDKQLLELKSFAPSGVVASTYEQLGGIWNTYKAALVSGKPDQGHAGAVLAAEGKVLQLAQQGTAQLESASGKSLGKLVNLAGRQRMLSQRSAKYYLATMWGVDAATSQAELARARSEFNAALQVLMQAPETTAQIRAELSVVAQQWVFFESALEQRSLAAQNAQHASEVFMSSENILSQMDRITGLYARLHAA